MARRAELFNRLRGTLIVAGAIAIAAIAVGVYAGLRYEQHQVGRIEQARLQSEILGQVRAMRTTEADARQFVTAYDRLAGAGVVGSWNKLAMIDRFEAAIAPWQGRVDRFAIAATPAPAADAGAAGSAHQLWQARISFEIDPIHEPDLLAALSAAARSDLGIADIEQCELRRRGAADDPQLGASCTLAWHYFEPQAQAQAATPTPPTVATLPAPGSERPARAADGIALARLFLTPDLRARVALGPLPPVADAPVRSDPPAAAPTVAAERRLGGYIRRDDGTTVVWLDGEPAVLARADRLDPRGPRLDPDVELTPLAGRGWRRTGAVDGAWQSPGGR